MGKLWFMSSTPTLPFVISLDTPTHTLTWRYEATSAANSFSVGGNFRHQNMFVLLRTEKVILCPNMSKLRIEFKRFANHSILVVFTVCTPQLCLIL